MLLIMKRQILVSIREVSNIFWTLFFPLLLRFQRFLFLRGEQAQIFAQIVPAQLLESTAHFGLENDEQGNDAEIEEIVENIEHHAKLKHIGGQPNTQQQQNALDKLFGTCLPHQLDKAENDEGDQQNVQHGRDCKRGDEADKLTPQIGEEPGALRPEFRQQLHVLSSFPLLTQSRCRAQERTAAAFSAASAQGVPHTAFRTGGTSPGRERPYHRLILPYPGTDSKLFFMNGL